MHDIELKDEMDLAVGEGAAIVAAFQLADPNPFTARPHVLRSV